MQPIRVGGVHDQAAVGFLFGRHEGESVLHFDLPAGEVAQRNSPDQLRPVRGIDFVLRGKLESARLGIDGDPAVFSLDFFPVREVHTFRQQPGMITSKPQLPRILQRTDIDPIGQNGE